MVPGTKRPWIASDGVRSGRAPLVGGRLSPARVSSAETESSGGVTAPQAGQKRAPGATSFEQARHTGIGGPDCSQPPEPEERLLAGDPRQPDGLGGVVLDHEA